MAATVKWRRRRLGVAVLLVCSIVLKAVAAFVRVETREVRTDGEFNQLLEQVLENTTTKTLVVHANSPECGYAASISEQFAEAIGLFRSLAKHLLPANDATSANGARSSNERVIFASLDVSECPFALKRLGTHYLPALGVLGARSGGGIRLIPRARNSWDLVNEILLEKGLLRVKDAEKFLEFTGPSLPVIFARIPRSNAATALSQLQTLRGLSERPRSRSEAPSLCSYLPFAYYIEGPNDATPERRNGEDNLTLTVDVYDGLPHAGNRRVPEPLRGGVKATAAYLERLCAPMISNLTEKNFKTYLSFDLLLFVGFRSQFTAISEWVMRLAQLVRDRLLTVTLYTDEFNSQAWGTLGIHDIPSLYVHTANFSVYALQEPVSANVDIMHLRDVASAALLGKVPRKLRELTMDPAYSNDVLEMVDVLVDAGGNDGLHTSNWEDPMSGSMAVSVTRASFLPQLQDWNARKLRIVGVLRPSGFESKRLERWLNEVDIHKGRSAMFSALVFKIDGMSNDLQNALSVRALVSGPLPHLVCFPRGSMEGIVHQGSITRQSMLKFIHSRCT